MWGWSGVPTVPVCTRATRYRYPYLRCARHGATRHGGLPERPMGADCKSVAKATKVRILHPPQPVRTAPDLGKPGRGPIFWSGLSGSLAMGDVGARGGRQILGRTAWPAGRP